MVNKAELRQFLTQYFSDIELDELCFDYFPDLLNEFTAGMTKSQKAIALIGYCERRGRLDHLLTALAQLRAQAFARQFGLVPALKKSDRAEKRNPNQVFLSHANQDAAFAQQLAGDLRRAGVEVWIAPDSIRPGEKWVDAINRGLETSGSFVLVMTARAAASSWVRDESGYAIALENKDEMRFITLEVDGGQVPPLWSVRQHISFLEDYDDGLRELLAVLRPGHAAKSAAAVPPSEEPVKKEPPHDPRQDRAPARTTAKPAPTAGTARAVEAARETKPAPEPVAATEPEPVVEKPPAKPIGSTPTPQPALEPAATTPTTVEPPPAARAAEPVIAAAAETSTQQLITPIGQPDPAPIEQPATTLPVKLLYLALGVVALLAAVMFIDWRTYPTPTLSAVEEVTPTRPAPTLTRTPTQTSSQPGEVRAVMRGDVAVEQVFVPAGSFMMGSEDGDSDEAPVHEVTLDAFWIDRTEVTNVQWAACVADLACQLPNATASHTRGNYYDSAQYADYPVIFVSWNDAHDFCSWAGSRLPTEAEWEYAARGPEAPTYPWGYDAPSSSLLNYGFSVGDTSEAGSYPAGASWVGALDMAGNVWEWVNDWYDSEYYGSSPGENPHGPASGEWRVLRGGAWNEIVNDVRSANRLNGLPSINFRNIGFRCAQE